jgi:hypothetical protein
MPERSEARERERKDAIGVPPARVGDEPDAAGIVLERRVVERTARRTRTWGHQRLRERQSDRPEGFGRSHRGRISEPGDERPDR